MFTVRRMKSTTIKGNKNGPIKDPKISLSNFFMKCYRPAFLLTGQFHKGCNINCKIFYVMLILSPDDFLKRPYQAFPNGFLLFIIIGVAIIYDPQKKSLRQFILI